MVLRQNYDQRIGIIGSKNVSHKLNASFVQILDDCQQLYIKYSTKAGPYLPLAGTQFNFYIFRGAILEVPKF